MQQVSKIVPKKKVYKRDFGFDVKNCPFEEKTQANLQLAGD